MLRMFKLNNKRYVIHSVNKQLVRMLVRLIAVTVIDWLIVSPLHALACDCYIPENALEALEKSDAVFTGAASSSLKVESSICFTPTKPENNIMSLTAEDRQLLRTAQKI